MKEQVGIDETLIIEKLAGDTASTYGKDGPVRIVVPDNFTLIDKSEYDRLKRLEGNVKNKIAETKAKLESAKTHADLLPCPFCSEPARLNNDYRVYVECSNCYAHTASFTINNEYKDQIDLYCDQVKGWWNTRVNKEAEFLEELKRYLRSRAFKFNKGIGAMLGELTLADDKWLIYADDVIAKIELFQAEQKANDENT